MTKKQEQMISLTQQLKDATRAYIVDLTPQAKGMQDRYAVYLQTTNEPLEVLWPANAHDPKLLKAEMEESKLYSLKYSSRKNLPAFHFSLGGYGYSKSHHIACELRAINPALEVFTAGTGYSPSRVSM